MTYGQKNRFCNNVTCYIKSIREYSYQAEQKKSTRSSEKNVAPSPEHLGENFSG